MVNSWKRSQLPNPSLANEVERYFVTATIIDASLQQHNYQTKGINEHKLTNIGF